jgi:hypothetical protein
VDKNWKSKQHQRGDLFEKLFAQLPNLVELDIDHFYEMSPVVLILLPGRLGLRNLSVTGGLVVPGRSVEYTPTLPLAYLIRNNPIISSLKLSHVEWDYHERCGLDEEAGPIQLVKAISSLSRLKVLGVRHHRQIVGGPVCQWRALRSLPRGLQTHPPGRSRCHPRCPRLDSHPAHPG